MLSIKKFKFNIYTQFLIRLITIYALYTITRIAFYLFNIDTYENLSFSTITYILYGGLKFDTAGIIYTNGLFFLLSIHPFGRENKIYKSILKYTFIIINSIALFANCSDIIYFRFTGKRTTSTIFSEFSNESNMVKLFTQFFIDYWYATLLFIICVLILVKVYKKTDFKLEPLFKTTISKIISTIVALSIVGILSIGGIRGGFTRTTRPISLSNAGQFVKKPNQMAIVLNTPFAIIRTIGKNDFKRINYYKSTEELEQQFNPVKIVEKNATMKKKNVVLIILESCAREHSQFANEQMFGLKDYKGYMPFMDSLMKKSLTFVNAYANGHKSIDALPSASSSIPRISRVPFVLSHRSSNKINSLASLLETKGYNSSFFFGSPNGSMGFAALMKMLGYDDTYEQGEYNNDDDFDGFWGIWDEKFLQFFGDKLNSFKTPFISTIFTVSSHHPFNIPEEYKEKFKPGEVPLQRCISYTDFALQQFFKKVGKMPWFKNTLFIITADHTNQVAHDNYKTPLQKSAVPLIFYAPGDTTINKVDKQLAQQIDILPTVMGYLGFTDDFISFGNNLLDEKNERFMVNYTSNCYMFAMDNYVILFDGKKTINMFDYKNDLLNQNNLVGTKPEQQDKMEKKLKAIIQQYNNRMLDNKLTVE